MQAITVRDHDAGVGGLSLTDVPYPHAAQNASSYECMPPGSPPANWSGHRPGSTAPDATGRRACPATSCRESSSSWGMGPRA